MQTQKIIKSILVICFALMAFSCGKKDSTTMNMDAMSVTMTYLPNPIVKNTIITFTFDVKENGTLTAVLKPSFDVVKGTSINTVVASAVKDGEYTGTYTFSDAGNYTIHFKYNHENMDASQDFQMTIQ